MFSLFLRTHTFRVCPMWQQAHGAIGHLLQIHNVVWCRCFMMSRIYSVVRHWCSVALIVLIVEVHTSVIYIIIRLTGLPIVVVVIPFWG